MHIQGICHKYNMRKLSQITEGLWNGIVDRGSTGRKRKEDKIRYYPETHDELKEIIKKEIEEQGGVDVDLRMIDVSNVDNMCSVFYKCSSLKSLDVSNWDVSKVKDMCDMFDDCKSLQSLDLSNWNVSNVEDMRKKVHLQY